jgi:O-antigen/teichoic acid export membrane protein
MVMTPVTVTLMVLAGPILRVWLGSRYAASATSMTIFVSYWLPAACPSIGLTMLVAVGRVRIAAIYASTVAALNLTLSLTLTPSLGVEGIVLGTSIAYFALLPVLMLFVCRTFGVAVREIAREGYGTAFGVGALLAGFELLARYLLPIDRALVLLATVAVGLSGYAATIYRAGLQPNERALVRSLLAGMRPRRPV